MPTITLHLGQAVPWRAAPAGIAQISELRRKRVEICYLQLCRKGPRIRRVVLPVSAIDRLIRDFPLLFPNDNLYRRGIVPRQKTYVLPPPPVQGGGMAKTLFIEE